MEARWVVAGQKADFGRSVKGLRLPADDLPDYVERLARRFTEERTADETFSDWAIRLTSSFLKPPTGNRVLASASALTACRK